MFQSLRIWKMWTAERWIGALYWLLARCWSSRLIKWPGVEPRIASHSHGARFTKCGCTRFAGSICACRTTQTLSRVIANTPIQSTSISETNNLFVKEAIGAKALNGAIWIRPLHLHDTGPVGPHPREMDQPTIVMCIRASITSAESTPIIRRIKEIFGAGSHNDSRHCLL